jgi:hypothetical protein
MKIAFQFLLTSYFLTQSQNLLEWSEMTKLKFWFNKEFL